ncbi:hypothetical protein HPB49_018944 [Dermacentor silvarum]|uniref:Uncharacterized protein n=1 Tax=Dermacentor silvarum TaxID=543639 RepID=A0ACB8C4Z3_DERSI|nr:hypothetical protein HPB49_018944 [Dermacentor silvarum]
MNDMRGQSHNNRWCDQEEEVSGMRHAWLAAAVWLAAALPDQEDDRALQPGVPCDEWDASTGTCFFRRQVGDTVTLWLRSAGTGVGRVTWRRRYRALDGSSSHGSGDAVVELRPDTAPWNVAIGAGELRISPITDSDLEPNSWEAVAGPLGNLSFRLELLPVDLGPVFRGDQLTINLEHYLTLPLESLHFRWDWDYQPLATNMRVSRSGRSLRITGLRRSQGGLLACSVYSSTGLLVARRRFRLREPIEEPLPELQSPFQLQQIGSRVKRGVVEADTTDSRLLAPCTRHTQCGLHASCRARYCVCGAGYVGNGLFCWESAAAAAAAGGG